MILKALARAHDDTELQFSQLFRADTLEQTQKLGSWSWDYPGKYSGGRGVTVGDSCFKNYSGCYREERLKK